MLNPYLTMMKDWKVINARMDRRTYWSAMLTMLVIICVLLWFSSKIPALGFLPAVFTLVNLMPLATATVKRLHDVQKSGWWILLLLVPVIGWVGLFIYLVLDTANKKKEKDQQRIPEPRLGTRL